MLKSRDKISGMKSMPFVHPIQAFSNTLVAGRAALGPCEKNI